MITAVFRAFTQLFGHRLRRVVLISLVLSLAFFSLILTSIWFVLFNTEFVSVYMAQWGEDWAQWAETAIDGLGFVVALIAAWFLFPVICITVSGFLLEDVARAVEEKYYPDLPPARSQPLGETMATTAKFLLITVAVNIPILFLLLIPPVYPFLPFVFYLVNGYLAGREYFELVAHRRADSRLASEMRKKLFMRLIVVGIGIAFLMTIPIVNLVVPVFATAAMLHLFEKWRARGLLPEVAT